MTSPEQKTKKAHCNSCGQETNHAIIASRRKQYGRPSETYTYEMLECCGCENITMRCSSWFSGEEGIGVIYCPPAVSRRLPQWAVDLPNNEWTLLNEVYAALHAGSHRLAMMGARALIDVALVSKVGDQGTFAKTLAKGESKGYIGKQNQTVLDAAFDAGSAAAHRGHNANAKEVSQVLDIVENLLQSVYVLESLADDLREKTPPRTKSPEK